MDDKEFKERSERLKAIGKILEELPSEVRALAFSFLSEYVTSASSGLHPPSPKEKSPATRTNTPPPADREGFFKAFDHERPADNAKLLAGWLYREFGTEPFSIDEIKELATDIGVTIPERIDMTFAQAKENAKNLFARAGRGRFKPTVHGEAFLKTTYKISKGTKQRPTKPE